MCKTFNNNMAEKSKAPVGGPGQKVVSMKLFASWESEKSQPCCIPRICSLTFTRLKILKALENELNAVNVAVKMQTSKRLLRSNEIEVPAGGVVDAVLDLSFMLQYPHFLKRDVNKLHVMLQRRKRYKNKQIPGYKTLAVGQINMAQILQHPVDKELNLYASLKDGTNIMAKVSMHALSSQPVDHEEIQNGHRKPISSDIDRSPDVDNESDFEEGEDSSNYELSDSEPMMLEEHSRPRARKSSRNKDSSVISRQRNIKQKFVALLKKFKVTEEVLDSEADHDLVDPDTNPHEIDDLFDQLEDLSDSDPDLEAEDNVSVMSTPKPRLRPFFTGGGSHNNIDRHVDLYGKGSDDTSSNSHAEHDMDQDIAELPIIIINNEPVSSDYHKLDIGKPKSPLHKSAQISRERSTSYKEKKNKKEQKPSSRRNSTGCVENLPRKALLDQLGIILGDVDDRLPVHVFLVNTAEWQGQLLTQKLQEKQFKLICTCSDADVKASVSALVTKIQKFCNSNSKNPSTIKVAIAGGDAYVNSVLRPYVEQFSAKSPDWQSYIKFLVIPFGASSIGKYLSSVDNTYNSLFNDSLWKDTFEKNETGKLDTQELVNRISKYMSTATGTVSIPIAEAMIMCRVKGGEDDSSQIFVPFLSEIKIGTIDILNASVDFDDYLTSQPSLSSSPPVNVSSAEKQKDLHTPPNSPNVTGSPASGGFTPSVPPAATPGEFMELQVDYWTVANKPESADKGDKSSKKDSNKFSLKSAFRSLYVCRLPASGVVVADPQFSMMVVTKEKKQKIRLGKKPKEVESKSQVIDGISRLICTSKSQNYSLKVVVDGVEWTGVKFFQLSSQWQTHMKQFPVAVFSHHDPVFSIT
ncbi:hypothetical protein ACJMK2_036310 [Sinanodonta woodiana]|uniref:Phosphofurin acidic cluster sorting protein 2 n=1 Tax=Sinanodonta woodiana TaxID=1069815 RepID=A0ABD3WK66_SINWO